ncbi:DUF3560 domain-containing protein [Pseudoalteromonas luteoviolacea]|uniref:DUF3560 domain-containing protein n=1 Tax=Pseudoalteromonas luteoviolacea TaxID=43657 RepID=UPI001B37F734|nr:DUF3560 domain-containing protein [Pseudoalteromonas luteoviolacea]MBQ4839786.1 DUF3560 domain-containing protein [Pseudoalteromonas luteoviolacea]
MTKHQEAKTLIFNLELDQDDFTATYSPEDDKLRIYTSHWFERDEYLALKELGFRHAPKQDLIYTHWTPLREDICTFLAGEVTAEQTSLVERAQERAARFDGYSSNRMADSNQFVAAANRLSERFAAGQPILIGHHSEARARRDRERMESNMRKAVGMARTSNYWAYRAEGVEAYANLKSNPKTRMNRIKKLAAELRGYQRTINHSHKCIEIWQALAEKPDGPELDSLTIETAGGCLSVISTGQVSGYGTWSALKDGSLSTRQAIEQNLNMHTTVIESQSRARCIIHLLNRLGYERHELGGVPHYDGELSATILQGFLREHGADKPKAKKTETGWKVSSEVPLPLHLSDSSEIELDESGWRSLMQTAGYTVPDKQPAKPPILNFKAESVSYVSYGTEYKIEQIELTKAEYKKIYHEHRGVKLSKCGTFRFKICKDPSEGGIFAPWVAVFLSDSKAHPAPDSDSYTSLSDAEVIQ